MNWVVKFLIWGFCFFCFLIMLSVIELMYLELFFWLIGVVVFLVIIGLVSWMVGLVIFWLCYEEMVVFLVYV